MKYLKNPKLILILIILLGAFLRFYKLDWGEGFFFNPDENDVGISVNQLAFPDQMHPHMFKYGTFNIYLIYFTRELLGSINLELHPLLIGRFYSAFFSTITIFIIYLISRKIFTKNWALLSALLVALTPGLIQQAHFATPETNQIFFLFLSLLFILYYIQHLKVFYLLISSISFGFALSVKISSLAFLPVIPIALFLVYKLKISKIIFTFLMVTVTVVSIFLISSPYALIDYQSFQRSILFEKQVAMGEIPVFYTRQFIDTVPILFQFINIFPFALGQILHIFGILGLLFIILTLLKRPNKILILVTISFLFILFSNALLFVKWTRYISPVLPYFAIFAIYSIYKIREWSKISALFLNISLLLGTAFWAIAFFLIYINHDTRIVASEWFNLNVPKNASVIVESANVVDVPIMGWNNRHSLDFYNLDTNSEQSSDILTKLEQSDYFIVQSRRVFYNHERLRYLFPKTAKFYNKLFNGQLGFEEIKEFHSYPSSPFPGVNIEFPDEEAEETWSVFDHPVVRIYQKKIAFSKEDYEKILKN